MIPMLKIIIICSPEFYTFLIEFSPQIILQKTYVVCFAVCPPIQNCFCHPCMRSCYSLVDFWFCSKILKFQFQFLWGCRLSYTGPIEELKLENFTDILVFRFRAKPKYDLWFVCWAKGISSECHYQIHYSKNTIYCWFEKSKLQNIKQQF